MTRTELYLKECTLMQRCLQKQRDPKMAVHYGCAVHTNLECNDCSRGTQNDVLPFD